VPPWRWIASSKVSWLAIGMLLPKNEIS
jgi:hypothetical protein